MAHVRLIAQVHHGTLIRCNRCSGKVTGWNGILAEKARALR
jgi:hypothetical protein